MMIFHREIISIHKVGTLPEYRSKGLGFAVIHKLLIDAQTLGFKQAILFGSKMGAPIYKRIGFREYALYKVYGN